MTTLDRAAEHRPRPHTDVSKILASIDPHRILVLLEEMQAIASPTGYTDTIVRHVCGWLGALGVDNELTRRGAIRVNLPGEPVEPGPGDRQPPRHAGRPGHLAEAQRSAWRAAHRHLGGAVRGRGAR